MQFLSTIYKYTNCHMFVYMLVSSPCVSFVHWLTPQPVDLLHASSLFIVFLYVWLTCHPQKMFASSRHSRLDTLAWSQPELRLKKDRQFGSGLFIVSHTCSHSADYVLIRRLTWGDQGLSCLTLSVIFVAVFQDCWGVANQDKSYNFFRSFSLLTKSTKAQT